MFKAKRIIDFFKSKKDKITFAELQLTHRHPVNIRLDDGTFTTIISDYDDSEIIVSPRRSASDPELELQVGDDVPILIPQSFGAYKGLTKVKSISGSQQFITLELCDTLREKQDRKFYRLPVSIDIDYSPMQGPKARHFTRSHTVDLSEGGVRFYVTDSFHVGYSLYTSFDIKAGDTEAHLLLPAKVVHTQQTGNKDTVGVKFIDIPERKQEILSSFISAEFEQQATTEMDRFSQVGIEHTRIGYEEAVQVFLHWCRRRELRLSWVILYDIHEFRDWLEIRGYSESEIDLWIGHIIQYL